MSNEEGHKMRAMPSRWANAIIDAFFEAMYCHLLFHALKICPWQRCKRVTKNMEARRMGYTKLHSPPNAAVSSTKSLFLFEGGDLLGDTAIM